MAKEGVEEGNKDLQLNVVDTYFFLNSSMEKINEDSEQLDTHYTLYIRMYLKRIETRTKGKVETIKNFELKNSNMTFAD